MNDVTKKAAQVKRSISRDPWNITVHRRDVSGETDEINFPAVGAIHLSSAKPSPIYSALSSRGEDTAVQIQWVLLLASGTRELQVKDEIRAVQQADAGAVERVFSVVGITRFPYKQEAFMVERQ
jgi:hypothetical protein